MILDNMKPYEHELVTKGFDGMSVINQNELIAKLANNFGVSYFNVEHSMILDVHKTLKLRLLEEDYNMTIDGGYLDMNNGHLYDMSTSSQADFNSVRILLESKPQEHINWMTEDSGEVSHTSAEWLAVFEGLTLCKQELKHKYISLCKKTTDATSHQEILDIKWDA
ncbi:tail fiber protein [Bacillus phage Bastille]|uniref:DUF4376 domain-containing protein n=2 Tax=Bastillevirus TaxID=1918010 RepID=J9PKF8_9CAUD|nr:tail fiber protein [Bacillus phage Bastille]YP_009035293.1 tail fiber protein [Bacillus phage Hoody T]AEQ34229.1 hypothetical protein [Bacillus phage Bastille]AHZ10408.1 hypothetical protein [Bacillus phage Hoody T]